MKQSSARTHSVLIAVVLSLAPAALDANGQSPVSIGGRTIQMTISGGTFPFAANGSYRFLPAAAETARYAIVPISGNVNPSTGTHTYTKTGVNTATLALADSGVGALTANCTFNTANTGTYLLTSTAAPGASQSGTFLLYAGASPATIAGATVTVTITSGATPFATTGSYRFLPAGSGNAYLITAISGDAVNSSGTYSYSQDSAYTGVLAYNDSVAGSGLSSQLSFDSPTTGTVFLRKSGSAGYQTGLFTIAFPADPPTITEQPLSQTIAVGSSVTFTVSATGTPPLTFQWRKNNTPIDGATNATFTIVSATAAKQATYDVVVTNAYGTRTSNPAMLTVNTDGPAWTLLDERGLSGFAGMHLFFNVPVSGGVAELRVQTSGGTGDCDLFVKRGSQPDYFDFAAYDHQSRHRKTPGGPEDGNEELIRVANPSAGTYNVLVYGYSAFEGADLLVTQVGPPKILTSPQNLTVFEGQTARFAVQAAGTPPLTYQWRKDGKAISGAASADLAIAAATWSDAGDYDVVVTSPHGSATSSTGTLTVDALPHRTPLAWLRSFGLTGDPVLLELADPDGDGQPCWQEYVGGTNPTNRTSVLRIVETKRDGPYFTLTFPTQIGRTYRLESSDQLGEWQTLIPEIAGSGENAIAGDPRGLGAASHRFYRVLIASFSPDIPGMVWIPPGPFLMGSPANELDRRDDEGPQTQVTFSKGFWIGKYEVTQRQYLAVMGANPSYWVGDLDWPVDRVSWYAAAEYCTKLTALERAAGWFPAGYEYRLPSEAQWEYACRAGTTTATAFGDSLSSTQANFDGRYPYNGGAMGSEFGRKKVGSYAPNSFGLYDMHGNVWEWCADWYSGSYPGGSVTDPEGPSSGSDRVFRGGGSCSRGEECRSAFRFPASPEERNPCLGFRVVLVAVP